MQPTVAPPPTQIIEVRRSSRSPSPRCRGSRSPSRDYDCRRDRSPTRDYGDRHRDRSPPRDYDDRRRRRSPTRDYDDCRRDRSPPEITIAGAGAILVHLPIHPSLRLSLWLIDARCPLRSDDDSDGVLLHTSIRLHSYLRLSL